MQERPSKVTYVMCPPLSLTKTLVTDSLGIKTKKSASNSYYSPSWTVQIDNMTIPGVQLAAKISPGQI